MNIHSYIHLIGALLTPELAEKITILWQSKGIQQTYERREEFWCLDATPYYLNEGKLYNIIFLYYMIHILRVCIYLPAYLFI